MRPTISLELLALNLKLLSKKNKRKVLLSAGKIADKQKLLPAIRRALSLGLEVCATPNTHKFLGEKGVQSVEVHKIAEGKSPNILTLFKDNRFDLAINILTGDTDYDEASDAKIIRSFSIENGIPLITDVDVAIATLDQIVKDSERETYRYRLDDNSEPWNMQMNFLQQVGELGGFACHHAHFDKAYLITPDNLRLSQVDMQKKWELYKFLKENYTHDDLVERISRGVDAMIAQGVTYCRTMVDADSTVKTLPIEAAIEVKSKYEGRLNFEIGVQPLQGVLDEESYEYFEEACKLADFVGGLPSRDRPEPEKHLDIIMELASNLGKPLDVHIDQENNPLENETELLARKTIEHGLQGRVFGIHAISLAAKPEHEQERIIELMGEADLAIVVCPSAALSMKPLAVTAPLHNSIAPVEKLLNAGLRCYMGVDNIHDLFMPMVDGDMWYECRTLMEACRFYDLERVAEIATRLPPQSGFARAAHRSS